MSNVVLDKKRNELVEYPAWYGIGMTLNNALTANDAMLAAGLTWKVEDINIYKKIANEYKIIDSYKAIQRLDTKEVFNIVGNNYHPIQNVDTFKSFDSLIKTGQAKYEVAGSLQGGRKVWVLVRLAYNFEVVKDDEIRSYLLLTSSHDGTLARQAFYMPVRVCSWSTLELKLSRAKYFKHTPNYEEKAEEHYPILTEAKKYFDELKQVTKKLIKIEMNSKQIDHFLNDLFDVREKEPPTRKKNMMLTIKDLINSGAGNDVQEIMNTAYAIYCAVCQFVDHERCTKGDEENRLVSSWFGSGANLREKAYNLLTERTY
jgi:phage/plasmid-like protein (TIGR03299 family)